MLRDAGHILLDRTGSGELGAVGQHQRGRLLDAVALRGLGILVGVELRVLEARLVHVLAGDLAVRAGLRGEEDCVLAVAPRGGEGGVLRLLLARAVVGQVLWYNSKGNRIGKKQGVFRVLVQFKEKYTRFAKDNLIQNGTFQKETSTMLHCLSLNGRSLALQHIKNLFDALAALFKRGEQRGFVRLRFLRGGDFVALRLGLHQRFQLSFLCLQRVGQLGDLLFDGGDLLVGILHHAGLGLVLGTLRSRHGRHLLLLNMKM